jgi:hypothetical protein
VISGSELTAARRSNTGRHRVPQDAPAGWRDAGPRTAVQALAAASVGLLILTIGYALGWSSRSHALTLFYVGLVVITLPCGWLLLTPGRDRRTLAVTSVGLGVLLYLAYYLSSPFIATRFDETLHAGTLYSLLAGDGLLHENPFLPISPYYPGLELATGAVRWMTGLPVVCCEFLIVLTCRVALLVLLFLLVERYSRSPRAAGIAVALYCTSSQFFFFNAQFAYQSLAIVFTLAAIYAIQQAIDAPAQRSRRISGTAVLALAALDVTHHLVSWMTLVLLWAWALTALVSGRRRAALIVTTAAAAGSILAAVWIAVLGSRLSSYLGPLFTGAGGQLVGVVSGQQSSRRVFADSSGEVTPSWEVLAIDGSVILWSLLAAVAGWSVLRKRTLGWTRQRWLPLAVAVTYPLLIVVRISSSATSIADRASTFVLMALAFVVAAWLTSRPRRRRPRILVVAAFAMLMVGGTILGSGPDWSRVPGPYLVSAEQRSIDAATLAAATWAGSSLPAGSRVATDVTFDRLLPSTSSLHPVTLTGGEANVSEIFYADRVDQPVRQLIARQRISFLIVDTRLPTGRPKSGWYFESPVSQEPLLTRAQIEKFEHAQGVVKLYEGPVRIYDVRSMLPAGTAAVAGPPAAKPGLLSIRYGQVGWTVLLIILICGLARRRRLPGRTVLLAPIWSQAGLVGVGALGAAFGFRQWLGVGLETVAAAGLAAAILRGTVGEAAGPWRLSRLLRTGRGALAVLVIGLLASSAVALISSHRALFPRTSPGHAVSEVLERPTNPGDAHAERAI